MAKQKTKDIPFGNKATLDEKGVWRWAVGGRKWWFIPDRMGMNSGTVDDDGRDTTMIYAKGINEMAMFAEGFIAGQEYQTRVTATSNEVPKETT